MNKRPRRVLFTMLDAIDRQIVHIMTIEPRASFRTIAEVTGISDQIAARRYRKLSESAGLRVLGVVNGPRALYEYLTGPLAALPGVTSVETAPIIRTLKCTGSVP
jgi:DNA-binding Lrp family transcriptional regulator